MENENYNIPENNGQANSTEGLNRAQPEINVSEFQTVSQSMPPVYSYTSNDPNVSAEQPIQPSYPPTVEPTVRFDAVAKPSDNSSSTGIKVFFIILSITVALIIAISAGYILGGKGTTPELHFNASTPLSDKTDASYQSDITTVFNNVDPSVVSITVYTDKGIQGYASGVVYTEDGYIVTNDHIYSEIASARFMITLNDGKEYDGEFVAGDTRSDLAVLKINANGLKKATFGNSDQIAIGETVIAIGYPSGVAGGSILTSGTISSSSIRFSSTSSYSVKMIQTDTAINPGNSGGALVNMYSQVIGIPSVKMAGTQYDNVGYAIPSSTVVKVADSLIKYGYVEGRGKLGISYVAIDSVTAKVSDLPTGLQVQEINIDSELSGKGIKQGDIITYINDVEITDSNIALDIIEDTAPGVTMSFTVYHPSSGSIETVYAALVADQGNSSYTNQVAEEAVPDDPFSGGLDDFFSDH